MMISCTETEKDDLVHWESKLTINDRTCIDMIIDAPALCIQRFYLGLGSYLLSHIWENFSYNLEKNEKIKTSLGSGMTPL